MLKLWRKAPSSHEDLFIERYQQMLAWSLQLTGHDQQQAEDLVHDVFIQFSLLHPNLNEIQNIEGYLFTMLRNLQRSQLRRAARTPSSHLSLVDFDSAELGLQATDLRAHIQVQNELSLICRYACVRKQSSKAGSVLILRFFHGYYPSEIAQVLRTSRQAVAELLRVARFEVKLYLEDPSRLSFMSEIPAPDISPMSYARSPEGFLSESRETIFRSREGECFSIKQFQELYDANITEAIEAEALAHLVSCARCLEEVNHLLSLEPLSDRYPTDRLGPENRPKGGSGGPSSGGPSGPSSRNELVRKYRRKIKRVFEHSPKELHISVNGFVLGAQKVSAELSELTLNVDLTEELDFVEVFSEQGIRLLSLNVESPPEGAFEQRARVTLSDNRTLRTTLSFSGPWPTLHVVYNDPTLADVQSLKSKVQSPAEEVLGPKSEVLSLSPEADSLWARARKHWSDFGLWTFDFGLFLRPGAVTALFALIVTAVVLFIQLRGPIAPVSAAELLHRSAAAEESLAAKSDLVLHRTITLEERRLSEQQSPGSVMSRRLELWENGAQKIRALRVYDDQNRLVNGEWTRSDGARVLYDHSVKLRSEPARKSPDESLSFGDVWTLRLSAAEFSALIAHDENAQVRESADEYTITYQNNTSADGLKSATLKLNRPELRAISQTLIIRQGQELREYLFSESSFEQRATSAVPPAVFQPDPELLSLIEPGTRNPEVEARKSKPETGTPPPPVVVATAELEVEVLRLLNQASALSGEQISMTRTPQGQLRVQGIVDTEQRKRDVLGALAPVKDNPAVSLEILTADEALSRSRSKSAESKGATQIEGVTPSRDTIPVDNELRRYFAGQGISAERVDDEIRQFSRRVMSRSRQLRRHALALKQIVERFSAADLQTLDPDARAKWRAMIVEHGRGFQQEAASLRRDLESIFPAVASAPGAAANEIYQEGQLPQAVSRLYELASACDENVRLSFSITEASAASPVKSTQFWRSLKSAESLAGKISRQ
jgi:RNA polymerase sigma factor (sigma-70 family)